MDVPERPCRLFGVFVSGTGLGRHPAGGAPPGASRSTRCQSCPVGRARDLRGARALLSAGVQCRRPVPRRVLRPAGHARNRAHRCAGVSVPRRPVVPCVRRQCFFGSAGRTRPVRSGERNQPGRCRSANPDHSFCLEAAESPARLGGFDHAAGTHRDDRHALRGAPVQHAPQSALGSAHDA